MWKNEVLRGIQRISWKSKNAFLWFTFCVASAMTKRYKIRRNKAISAWDINNGWHLHASNSRVCARWKAKWIRLKIYEIQDSPHVMQQLTKVVKWRRLRKLIAGIKYIHEVVRRCPWILPGAPGEHTNCPKSASKDQVTGSLLTNTSGRHCHSWFLMRTTVTGEKWGHCPT